MSLNLAEWLAQQRDEYMRLAQTYPDDAEYYLGQRRAYVDALELVE